MSQPDPQYGFQLCSADDPQRTHFFGNVTGSWIELHPAAGSGFVWQKPIPLPDGLPPEKSEWELVPENELMHGQCVHYFNRDSKRWFDYGTVSDHEDWRTPRDYHRNQPIYLAFVRRKQPAQKGVEWVAIAKHGRPTEPGRYWCWNGYESLHFKVPYPETSWARITHWMKCELPPPPQSTAEKAWEEFQDEAKDWSPKAMFLAGFAKGGGR